MNRKVGQLISTILSPLVILIVLPYILVLKTTSNSSAAYFWTVISWIFLIFFSLFFLIGIEKGYFSDLDVSKRRQRPLLYTFSIALCAIYIVFLYLFKAPEVLFIAIIGLILGLVAMEFVNYFTKASIHVAAISAFATGITLGYGLIFVPSFLLVPLVSWARIKTHNHTIRQTLIGACMGILITLIVYVIFKYII